MRRIAPASVLIALALAAFMPVAAGAATTPRLPKGFIGMNADGPLYDDPAVNVATELGRMQATGITQIRAVFDWAQAQPTDAQTPPDLTKLDAIVGGAAAKGLTVLPVVIHSPTWAADLSGGGDPYSAPPKDPNAYATFLKALVARYGPVGSYWAQNPAVPRRAIRNWQIWNEPNLPRFWAKQPFAKPYTALLKASAAAVRGADPGAKIYTAGITNGYHSPSWSALGELYAAGAKGSFDVIAVHPYTGTPAKVIETLRRVRAVAVRHGGAKTPLALTELSWSSGGGHKTGVTWDTTEAGQATRLTQVFQTIARSRLSLRIGSAYWYTWLSRQGTSADGWEFFAGVNRMQNGRVVPKPALTALRKAIRGEAVR